MSTPAVGSAAASAAASSGRPEARARSALRRTAEAVMSYYLTVRPRIEESSRALGVVKHDATRVVKRVGNPSNLGETQGGLLTSYKEAHTSYAETLQVHSQLTRAIRHFTRPETSEDTIRLVLESEGEEQAQALKAKGPALQSIIDVLTRAANRLLTGKATFESQRTSAAKEMNLMYYRGDDPNPLSVSSTIWGSTTFGSLNAKLGNWVAPTPESTADKFLVPMLDDDAGEISLEGSTTQKTDEETADMEVLEEALLRLEGNRKKEPEATGAAAAAAVATSEASEGELTAEEDAACAVPAELVHPDSSARAGNGTQVARSAVQEEDEEEEGDVQVGSGAPTPTTTPAPAASAASSGASSSANAPAGTVVPATASAASSRVTAAPTAGTSAVRRPAGLIATYVLSPGARGGASRLDFTGTDGKRG